MRAISCLAVLGSLLLFTTRTPAADPPPTAREQAQAILAATGVRGGFVVHLGCGDGRLTALLRKGEAYKVHGLDRSPENLERARRHIRDAGLYGPVSVDRLRGRELPYIDGIVNLLVAEDLDGVPMDEVRRVLVPGGAAYVRENGTWAKTVKPRPPEIDDWTHYLHDASGNAVAHDTAVGPPRHLQWLGNPRWSRHHDRMASLSALVSANGRIFYIMDEGSRVSIQLPPKWTLIARDASNGVVLWKREIPTWVHHLWPLKSGPTQLARRLVAAGDTVYVALGLRAPLSALDAATGETLRTFEGSAAAEEVIVSGGTAFVLVNRGEAETDRYVPAANAGDQRRAANEFLWNERPREIAAYDAATAKRLWSEVTRVAPLSLASDGERVYYHDGEKVVCRRSASGEELWRSEPIGRRRNIPMHFGPRLLAVEGVVLVAGGDRTVRALAAETGKELWSAPHARSGYQSPEDLLVVRGLVWSAPTTSTKDSGVFTGRDLRTGEVQVEFPPDVDTYWFHHRCYIAKATDRFLLPSRTGVEFVDPEAKSWEIHHWVRGGCLYGIMPANGLIYAPPHNCACYPEAKLFGFNALAPASPSRAAAASGERLERGPAFGTPLEPARDGSEWPAYRRDRERSGYTPEAVPAKLQPSWSAPVGGRLTSPVVAAGKVFVARIDGHSVHALDAASGGALWSFTVGGPVDSPPAVDRGRVYFGSADGHVYCLRTADGALVWRFRAAPRDLRLMAFEELESVWPVHGSVLAGGGALYFVAGRSNFLDGGLRFFKLDAEDGRVLAETTIDERDPETGEDVQRRLQVLNMTAGLSDILSADGKYVYMRSQRFDLDGKRRDVGPHSGNPAEQGAAQHGEGAHLFAPIGFLDDTWFHRAYWVYGRSFAGGHAGYYQAGRYAPSGRILVFDGEHVWGFARKEQYYRWTTTLEHHLFRAPKEPPRVETPAGAARRGGSMVRVAKSPSLDPTGRALAVEAWARPERRGGVVVARGGPAQGYALYFREGKPCFAVRSSSKLFTAEAVKAVELGEWVHLAGVLSAEKAIRLYVNGELAASAEAALIASDPVQSLEIGADAGGSAGEYPSPSAFTGTIDEVRVYRGALGEAEVRERAVELGRAPAKDAQLVLECSFDDGTGADGSGNENHGEVSGAQVTKGKIGNALRFSGRAPALASGGVFVQFDWTRDLPLFAGAMALAGKTLFVAGPPDLVDEEETFARITRRDTAVAEELAAQERALEGEYGALLHAIDAETGKTLAEYRLPAPPVWDGMAAAAGRLYVSTRDGHVRSYAPAE